MMKKLTPKTRRETLHRVDSRIAQLRRDRVPVNVCQIPGSVATLDCRYTRLQVTGVGIPGRPTTWAPQFSDDGETWFDSPAEYYAHRDKRAKAQRLPWWRRLFS